MAVTIQTLHDGPKNVVVLLQVALANTDAVVVDYSALTPPPTRLSLVEAQWSLTGAAATLEWEATTDLLALECAVGNGFMSFEDTPAPDTALATAGGSGDLVLTNVAGLTSGTILLKLRKQ